MPDGFTTHKEKLRAAKEALKTAGPVHARDLQRQIRHMEKELRTYIRYQKQAGFTGQRAAAAARETV